MAKTCSREEYDALAKLLEKTKVQLSSCESEVEVLKEDNNRLQAALAVVQGARDSDALNKAKHDLHLVNYRYSRIMKFFDRLKLERPSTRTDLRMFMSDDHIEDAISKLNEMFTKRAEQKVNRQKKKDFDMSNGENWVEEKDDAQVTPVVEKNPAESNGANHTQQVQKEQVDPVAIGENTNDVQMSDAPGEVENIPPKENDKPAEEVKNAVLDGQEQPEGTVLPDQTKSTNEAEKLVTGPEATLIGDPNNADFIADVLRVLIGASSVALHESKKQVRVQMLNEAKKRSLVFSLSWTGEALRFWKESSSFGDDELPGLPSFLKEEDSIEFESAQAPNFLLTTMGAMLDFQVSSTIEESEPIKQTEDPPQASITVEENNTQVQDVSEKLSAPPTQFQNYGDNNDPQTVEGDKENTQAPAPTQPPSGPQGTDHGLENTSGLQSSAMGAQPRPMEIEEAQKTRV